MTIDLASLQSRDGARRVFARPGGGVMLPHIPSLGPLASSLCGFPLFVFAFVGREGAWDKAARDPNDEMVSAGLTPDNIRKWEYLTGIQGQNETVSHENRFLFPLQEL